ncbi:MAG: hypothetical protein ABI406_10595 [Ktedonobacteraceae bacterium]
MSQGKLKSAGVQKDKTKKGEAGVVSEGGSKSEVARLRRRIEEEYGAAQRGLCGFAVMAQHAFITARMENVWVLREQLVTHVGEDEATRLMCESCAVAENQ